MDLLGVTIVQCEILWENPVENLKHYEHMLRHENNSSIIVFPEMFSSGFSIHPSEQVIQSAPMVLEWMKKLAHDKQSAVCGSQIVEVNENKLNRFYFAEPDGKVSYYDKKHLFGMGRENECFSQGSKIITISYSGFNIRPYICYDLRFPVWNRNRYDKITGNYEYDLLIYVANWPEPRIQHWEKLLQARAIENQAYVCGVNRMGTDENGMKYNGNSLMIDPLGEILFRASDNCENVQTIQVSRAELTRIRTSLPFANDWDQFIIQ